MGEKVGPTSIIRWIRIIFRIKDLVHFQSRSVNLNWPQSIRSWIEMIGGRSFWNALINKCNAFLEIKCSCTLMHKSQFLLNMMKYLNKIQINIPVGSFQIYCIYKRLKTIFKTLKNYFSCKHLKLKISFMNFTFILIVHSDIQTVNPHHICNFTCKSWSGI